MRPVIALAMGDPAGISPELTAKLLALDEVVDKARIVVIGDRRVFDDGARVAAVKLDLVSASPDTDISREERAPVFIDLGHLDPASVVRSTATAEGGRFALANYRRALTMARDGLADAVCFTPFNKNAMRSGEYLVTPLVKAWWHQQVRNAQAMRLRDTKGQA